MSTENTEITVKSEKEDSNNLQLFKNYTNLDELTKDGYKILMESIRTSNALPSGRNWNFFCTHESFLKIIESKRSHLLKLMNKILRFHNINGNIRNRILDEETELIVEANDVILEQVANNIDELNGIRKTVVAPPEIKTVSAQIPLNGSWNRNPTFSIGASINETNKGQSISLLAAKNIIRPQNFFKDKISNSGSYPFEPRIKEKPNSLKPLAIFLEETQRGEEYSHPYEFELERFEPTEYHLKDEEPVKPKNIQETPLVEVYDEEQLNSLLETLRNCKEFAVDLEHHSYRSFMGITCLMQISTTECDYLIDTLALRDKLHILNEVFTKPTILKIFHGADCDIQWLQRDLSIYVVNMFDTHQAAKILQYRTLSLAFLMKKYCNFMPNKKFQLADWRIRPLPDELKSYAREDTHYLIYIYQKMKRELYKKGNGMDNLLRSVFQNSNEICKIRYFKPIWHEDSYMDFYRKSKRMFDNQQLYALKGLYNWRDKLSREEDESTGYVLPNHMLLQICERLPREMQGILACCNPIPPLVRSNLLDLHKIILKAREQPLEKPILKEDTRARGTTKVSKLNIDSPLYCPHDLSKTNEFRDDLPTLLNDVEKCQLKSICDRNFPIEKTSTTCLVFNSIENYTNGRKVTFLSPFERYKLLKPFIQAEEQRNKERQEESSKEPQVSQSVVSEQNSSNETETKGEVFINLGEKSSKKQENQPVENVSKNIPLLEMGGSKKRKREPLLPDDDYHSDYQLPDNELHTSVPKLRNRDARFNKFKKQKNRKSQFNNTGKRKQSPSMKVEQNQSLDQVQENVRKLSSRAQKRINQLKKRIKQIENESAKKQKLNQDNVVENNDNGNQGNVEEIPTTSRQSARLRNGPKNVWKNSNKRRRNENNQEPFTPFDYSAVDFRQFQGGAIQPQQNKEFRSRFRGRGRKSQNYKNYNKSTIFNNSKGNNF